jgi:voltage-gated potassium channel
MDLKEIVEESGTPAARAFDLAIQALIVISLVSFCVETLPDLSPTAESWLYAIEVVTIAIFTIEYVVRILVADNRIKSVFSFFGIVDLIAILPFYLSAGIDLRAVRVLRFFRIFRAFKLLRYNRAIERLRRAFLFVKEELLLFFGATALVVFLSSVGIYYFEHDAQPEKFASVFHCMWWAIVTFTTVGYGDVYPITVGGRIFTAVILLLGLGIVAVPTGLLASALTETRSQEPRQSPPDAPSR